MLQEKNCSGEPARVIAINSAGAAKLTLSS
jgi:hypothetical protein